jgi:hypothetical protein
VRNLIKKIAVGGMATLLVGGIAFACSPQNNFKKHKDDHSSTYTQESEIGVEVENDAKIKNDLDLNADTGENEAEDNHGDGEVTTGNATLSADVSSEANSAEISVKAPSACNDCLTDVRGDVKVESSIKLEVVNDAYILNDLDLKANTGDNKAKDNCGDGTVSTGSAALSANVSNSVNSAKITIN